MADPDLELKGEWEWGGILFGLFSCLGEGALDPPLEKHSSDYLHMVTYHNNVFQNIHIALD